MAVKNFSIFFFALLFFASHFLQDVLERSTSICWNKKRQSSFRSMKKKIQGATNEIRNVASLLGNEGLEVVNPKELDNLLKEE
ncbi:hypothetical protein ES332_A08G122000v1 [Gossypium tomentosum]|nr:hypothetical protein ES332_A08G122000v1 [Gossypium tomentosum]